MLKLLKNMKGYGKECFLGPLLKLLEALIELCIPYVIMNMINIGIDGSDKNYIIGCVVLLVVMGFTGLALSITAQYFSAKAAVGFTAKVRGKLFAHIQSLSYKDIDRVGRSTLINRLTSDMNQIQTGINLALRLLLRSPFIVFGAAIMAFTIDAESALTFVVTIPMLAVVIFSIMLATIPLYKKVQSCLDKIISKTRENLGGARMLRALCKEDTEREEFNKKNNELFDAQSFVGKISTLLNPLTFVIINFGIAALIYKGAIKVESGVLTQAAVIALYNYMSQILVELIKLANLIISITKAFACGNRVQAVFDIDTAFVPEECADGSNDLAIEFSCVSFKYSNGGENALSNASFKIFDGQTVGVIGGTGSGKTTLVNLICGFYRPDDGEIFIEGRNTASLTGQDILSEISIVPQKSELFSGTVRSNVAFGNSDATDDEIYSALETANAKEFVDKLKDGLDSPVEQNGRNLSGGQRQRLSIARALVKRPKILILDDSSSALDYLTDLKLRRNISSLDYDPTVIIVSQRVSSVKDSDMILVLDEGIIVGIGTHDELIESCGVYNEIYESQRKGA